MEWRASGVRPRSPAIFQRATMEEQTRGVASGIVSGLKKEPMMLTLVALNLMGILIAYMFISSLVKESTSRFDKMFQLIQDCVQKKG